MKHIILTVFFIVSSTFSFPVFADNASQQFGTCMVDSLTGKERKQLARWIFFGMAAHPDINDYSNITPDTRNNSDKVIGRLITRLFSNDCPSEFKAAYKADSLAIQKAFELVGRVAMQELMTNENVNLAITGYVKHIDENKINSLTGK